MAEYSNFDPFHPGLTMLQSHPPMGITHCAAAYFTHVEPRGQQQLDSLPDLIVVRETLLQVYSVR